MTRLELGQSRVDDRRLPRPWVLPCKIESGICDRTIILLPDAHVCRARRAPHRRDPQSLQRSPVRPSVRWASRTVGQLHLAGRRCRRLPHHDGDLGRLLAHDESAAPASFRRESWTSVSLIAPGTFAMMPPPSDQAEVIEWCMEIDKRRRLFVMSSASCQPAHATHPCFVNDAGASGRDAERD